MHNSQAARSFRQGQQRTAPEPKTCTEAGALTAGHASTIALAVCLCGAVWCSARAKRPNQEASKPTVPHFSFQSYDASVLSAAALVLSQ